MTRRVRRNLILLGLTWVGIGCRDAAAPDPPLFADAGPRVVSVVDCDTQIIPDPECTGGGPPPMPYDHSDLDPSVQPVFNFPGSSALGCQNPLMSNVTAWIPINAVGNTPFTLFPPHQIINAFGGDKYRFVMLIGRSWDNNWMAEGPWVGYCRGNQYVGIGKFLKFEGTVWWVGTGPSGGGGGGGGGGSGGFELDISNWQCYSNEQGTSVICYNTGG